MNMGILPHSTCWPLRTSKYLRIPNKATSATVPESCSGVQSQMQGLSFFLSGVDHQFSTGSLLPHIFGCFSTTLPCTPPPTPTLRLQPEQDRYACLLHLFKLRLHQPSTRSKWKDALLSTQQVLSLCHSLHLLYHMA